MVMISESANHTRIYVSNSVVNNFACKNQSKPILKYCATHLFINSLLFVDPSEKWV